MLTSKLAAGDIVKITMNANLATIYTAGNNSGENNSDSGDDGPLKNLERKLGDYMPAGIARDADVNQKKLPKILAASIKFAMHNGLAGTPNLSAIPLACCSYDDGHQMITVSALIVEREKREQTIEEAGLRDSDFFTDSWDTISEIRVPDLSIKERLSIDEMIFSESTEQAHARLPFRLARDTKASKEALEQYFYHYNRYPSFQHVPL